MPLPFGNVAPGQSATFSFQVIAPLNPGAHAFQWGMQREGFGSFGPGTTPVTINVRVPVNNAEVVSMTAPARMQTKKSYDVAVTMRNTGTTTWMPGVYNLGSRNPTDSLIWGPARVAIATAVAPGQQYTFNFPVTAPAPGDYVMQWGVLSQVEWFGALASSPVTVTEDFSRVTFIHTDALGSPVARTDGAGALISRTRYEPYGYVASGATPTIGFTGHVNDVDTGLTYMQQRYYDPMAGRFLSIDPVVTDANTGGSFNRYAYANNSPYKYVDPDGRFAVFIHWGLTFAASINSGNSIRESVGFANRAWQADFESGSQGVTGEAVARHAMSNINQTTDQARDGNAQFVEKAVASGDLGLAGHAIQDRFAGGHANFALWEGFSKLGVLGTLQHILADVFPSSKALSGAYHETKAMFNSVKQGSDDKTSGQDQGSTTSSSSGINSGPQGCMAKGGNCWQ